VHETHFNSTHDQEYKLEHFPYPVWRDEGMHELLMQMARSVAGVIAQARDASQSPGNVMQSMLRVDVALSEQQGRVSSNVMFSFSDLTCKSYCRLPWTFEALPV